ncbi:MAG: ABC transporter substrate-binding protein [Burkholderiaceae bacterium]
MRSTIARILTACTTAAAAIALATAGASAAAQEKTKLRVSVIPIVDVSPLYAAIKLGYFKAEGLEVDPSPVAGGAAGIPGLMAGAYDLVFTNVVSSILARQQNLKVKLVAPGWSGGEPNDGAAVVVRKGEGLKRGADLNGKSLGVNTRNNIIWLYAAEWSARTGADVSKINFREIPFPQMVDALKGKQIDAAFIVEPFYTAARNEPSLEVIGMPYYTVHPNISVAQYVATEDFIAKNPETVRKFAAAIKKGAQWVNEHRKSNELFELVASYTKLNPSVVSQMLIGTAPLTVDAGSIEQTMTVMRKHGLLNTSFSATSMMHDTVR